MIATNPLDLEGAVDHALSIAEKRIAAKLDVTPMWALHRGPEIQLILTPWSDDASRAVSIELVRKAMAAFLPEAVVFLSETVMTTLAFKSTALVEGLMVIGTRREGRSIYRLKVIVRDEDGSGSLVEAGQADELVQRLTDHLWNWDDIPPETIAKIRAEMAAARPSVH